MPKNLTRKSVKMPSGLNASVSFKPSSIDRENRTVEFVFSTGEAGKRYDWYNDRYYLEELRLDNDSLRTARLDNGLPIKLDHERYDGVRGVVGVTESWQVNNNVLGGVARFSKRDDVETIFSDIEDGILRNVSLGYRVHKFEKIRGNDGELDTLRAIDIEPLELSLVDIPFESTNGVRKLDDDGKDNENITTVIIEEREMPKPNEPKVEGNVPVVEADQGQTRTAEEPKPETVKNVTEQPKVDADEIRKAEVARSTEINQVCADSGLGFKRASEFITEGKTIDEVRAIALAELTKKSDDKQVRNMGGEAMPKGTNNTKQLMRSAMTDAVMLRSGIKVDNVTDDARMFSRMSLLEMARHYLTECGVDTRFMDKRDVAQRALHTTSDFTVALADVMNKSLLQHYNEIENTFERFGRRRTFSDFRNVNVVRIGDAPDLRPLNEHGEYESGTFSESGESYAPDTFGRKIGLTRKLIINDDLNVFSMIPQMWADSARRMQGDLAWGALLGWDFANNVAKAYKMADGNDFYQGAGTETDNTVNLLTGATASALTEAGLSNARKHGRLMKTMDGKRMNVAYNDVIVPAALETTAEKLLVQGISATKDADTNPFKGRYGITVESRLDDISAKAWYLGTNNPTIPALEYGFLEGEQEIYTETKESFNTDGVEVKARMDFGVGLVDRKAFIKNKGEA